ncbi:hypothetical protein KEM55_007991, partial [Ascosphaera atra]
MEEKEKAEIAAEEAYNEEKRKKKEAEEAKKQEEEKQYWADTKKAEAEAEAAEEARAKKREEEKAKAAEPADKKPVSKLFDNLKAKQAAASTGAPTPSAPTTPAADAAAAMPPPAKPAAAAGVAGKKPTPLSKGGVEPPQPSAALKSLENARFLVDPFQVEYPPNIKGPDPALNTHAHAAERKFVYDAEFLLQFRNVYVDKPCVDWDKKVRESLGDTSAGETGGAGAGAGGRQPSMRGGQSRQGSRTGPSASHHGPRMGQFGGGPDTPSRMGNIGMGFMG